MTEEKTYKVKVLKDVCIGAGACETISDKVFKVGDDGKAYVVDQEAGPDEEGFVEVTKDTMENVLAAAKSCPTFAIVVKDHTGSQIYPEQ
jgi:ferredoxin